MKAYYNEHDPKAAAWLRELIAARAIADGEVDTRSIVDVQPDDLRGFTQVHFFAGIGGWSYALRLAGWPDDRPVWTGSCPCQPFSAAGKQQGTKDVRHLWPEFLRLIAIGRPPDIFGEQVASRLGRQWFSGVRADLEALGYGVGGADLCAASVGSPHIRQRLFWVAHREHARREGWVSGRQDSQGQDLNGHAGCGGATGGMGDTDRRGCEVVGIAQHPNEQGASGFQPNGSGDGRLGFWSNYDIIPCRDGKARRVESGTFPLAHGVSGRVGLLRGYGNAIVPEVAAVFIQAAEAAQGEFRNRANHVA